MSNETVEPISEKTERSETNEHDAEESLDQTTRKGSSSSGKREKRERKRRSTETGEKRERKKKKSRTNKNEVEEEESLPWIAPPLTAESQEEPLPQPSTSVVDTPVEMEVEKSEKQTTKEEKEETPKEDSAQSVQKITIPPREKNKDTISPLPLQSIDTSQVLSDEIMEARKKFQQQTSSMKRNQVKFKFSPNQTPKRNEVSLKTSAPHRGTVSEKTYPVVNGLALFLIKYTNGSMQFPYVVNVSYTPREAMNAFKQQFHSTIVESGPTRIHVGNQLKLITLFQDPYIKKTSFDHNQILGFLSVKHRAELSSTKEKMSVYLIEGHSNAQPTNCQSICLAPSPQMARVILAYCLRHHGMTVRLANLWNVLKIDVDGENLGKLFTFRNIPNRVAAQLQYRPIALHPRDIVDDDQGTFLTRQFPVQRHPIGGIL